MARHSTDELAAKILSEYSAFLREGAFGSCDADLHDQKIGIADSLNPNMRTATLDAKRLARWIVTLQE